MMPLLPDRSMRLTVSLNTAGDHAECLLDRGRGKR